LDEVESIPGDRATKVALYELSINLVKFYQPPAIKHLLREDLLSNYLDLASKDLTSLESNIEAYRFEGLANNFNLELLEAIKLKVPYNLTSYRGLYLCINFVEAIRLGEEYQRSRELTAGYV